MGIQEEIMTILEQEGDDSENHKVIAKLCTIFSISIEEATDIYNKWRRKRMKDPLHTWVITQKSVGLSNKTVEMCRKKIEKINKDDLYYLYITRRNSANSISKLYGVSNTTITKKLEEYNIPRRRIKKNLKTTREELYRLYITENKTAGEIADYYGLPCETIKGRIKMMGLSKKSVNA